MKTIKKGKFRLFKSRLDDRFHPIKSPPIFFDDLKPNSTFTSKYPLIKTWFRCTTMMTTNCSGRACQWYCLPFGPATAAELQLTFRKQIYSLFGSRERKIVIRFLVSLAQSLPTV